MGWETREQTCPHERGHGSLEGCSTVWVTGEKTKNRVAGRSRIHALARVERRGEWRARSKDLASSGKNPTR
jgi:hypothetical protein